MSDKHLSTRLVHTRGKRLDPATVNPPIERASTVLFSDANELYDAKPGYGRMGLAVHRELEAALCELENAQHAFLTPNGLSACALAVASVVKSGDHILTIDTLYGPTARFCGRRIEAMGVSATVFDPRIGRDALEALIQDNTVAIVLESPGSLTFECCDTQMIVTLARDRGLTTILDNTWGAGVFHRPLDLGVDISVQALTKYVVGHADGFGGAVMTNSRRHALRIEQCKDDWGISLSPDEAYIALRGLRTLSTRLARHEQVGLEIAEWLAKRDEVSRVLHPGLSDSPDHAVWKRDFTGSCGLFGVILKPTPDSAVRAMVESLSLFAMGFSWGGYESLLIPCDRQIKRTAPGHEQREGPLLRVHVGLEDAADLRADLEHGFACLNAAT